MRPTGNELRDNSGNISRESARSGAICVTHSPQVFVKRAPRAGKGLACHLD